MPYVKIDVCYNNCMLLYKDNKNKEKCDFYSANRYEDGGKKVPCKVLRYLPITDRLQRLYLHVEIAKLMHDLVPQRVVKWCTLVMEKLGSNLIMTALILHWIEEMCN
jgi:hypothetical protein